MHPFPILGWSPRNALRAIAAAIAVLLLACSQGDGEPCQQNRDCEDGLVCLAIGRAERSVCGSPEEIELDAGGGGEGEPTLPPDDAAAGDAATDGGDEPSEQDAGDEPSDLDAG